ncbi:MAG: hypothetical protein Q4D46_01260 [Erysipelotrichaceae bacterium]|nr:hypothetical protein [Erysipelotrichaceae bacterium]MDO5120681.1 hypothetical protein [Erysipelotrichaceae bacterium]
MLKKLPPSEKVYEAFSAIGDERVEMHEDHAIIRSSDASKQYTVEWDGDKYTSDDSATFWQGYPGYPVIAVLMLQGRLSMDEDVCRKMKGIAWKSINDAHKRDYSAALSEVMNDLEACGTDTSDIRKLADIVNEQLALLDIETGRKRKKK